MKLGAVLITTGKHANPMFPSGEITVAQRMIATLHKTGVTQIAVITGPDDKKMDNIMSLNEARKAYAEGRKIY